MFSPDRMMVNYYLGAHDLGIYAVAYSIAERAVMAVFLALGIASYPLVVRALERNGRDAARRQAQQNIDVLMAIAIPAWGGFTVASGQIAAVLAGPAYGERVADLLPLAGFAVFVYSLRIHYFSHAQHLTNKTWTMLLASIPAALVNVAMNVVPLPILWADGSSVESPGRVSARAGDQHLAVSGQFPLPFPVWGTAKALLATLAMCGLIRMLKLPNNTLGLIETVVIGASFYGAVALAFDLGGLRSSWQLRRRSRLPAV